MKKVKETNIDRIKLSPITTIFLILMLIYAISLLGMYFWGVLTSLKSKAEFRRNLFGFPEVWHFDNYINAFKLLKVRVVTLDSVKYVGLTEMLFNSVLFSGGGAFILIGTTWAVAYCITYFDYKFSKFVYRLNIILITIPIIGSLPAGLQIYKLLGAYDNWWYLVLSSMTFTGTNLLIFYAYFKGIAKGIQEAAVIDGANNLDVMLKITFPLTIKMFGILYLLEFITRWNNYMTMVIWMPSKPTLAYGLYKFGTSIDNSLSWPPMQITGCMILMIPILILFLIFKDKLIGQITMGAMKG